MSTLSEMQATGPTGTEAGSRAHVAGDTSGVHLALGTRALDYVAVSAEALVVVAVLATLGITFANTFCRYVLNSSIHWAEDATMIGLSMIAFPGAAA